MGMDSRGLSRGESTTGSGGKVCEKCAKRGKAVARAVEKPPPRPGPSVRFDRIAGFGGLTGRTRGQTPLPRTDRLGLPIQLPNGMMQYIEKIMIY